MSRKTELTKVAMSTPRSEKINWRELAKVLRERATILRVTYGDYQMASYLKRWAQRFER